MIQFHDNYTDQEQIIGKWIDDKPIYRKTVVITGGNLQKEPNPLAMVNIDGIIDISGKFIDIETMVNAKIFTDNTTDKGAKYFGNKFDNIEVYLTNEQLSYIDTDTCDVYDVSLLDSIMLTIEYTKRD